MKYYRITCLRGHCGRNKSVELTFAFCAKNITEATDRARKMPAVKHNHTRAILYGKEITYEEYRILREVSAYHR